MISRNILNILRKSKKSALLLGPRQVGKTTLMRSLKPDLGINLADQSEYFSFSSNPSELRERIETYKPHTVFIDEVQRLPSLLHTIQALLDEELVRQFYLTGSSARKLKRGGANLLPGRILNYSLGGFVASELDYKMDTKKVLRLGCLPELYQDSDEASNRHLLKSYVTNYVSEEIKAEALVRNLEAFTRFSRVAIHHSGSFVDYSKLAKQAKVSRHAFYRFYEIFEDTLIGQRLWPFEPLKDECDLIKHPKFYLFDNGVYNATLENFEVSVDRRGVLAEQLIYNQVLHSAWSRLKDISISSFRTRGGLEVDFIVRLDGDVFAIEVKSSDVRSESDIQALLAFKKYYPRTKDLFIFHLGNKSTKIKGVWCHPWQEGLRSIGL